MDRVKFGRALGYGARHAAKALKTAAEAAAAPGPEGNRPHPATQQTPPNRPVGTAATAASAVRQARDLAAEVQAQRSKVNAAKGSLFAPLKNYSSSVLLQVMGTIFALFALVLSQAVWRLRTAFHAPYASSQAQRLYLASVMFLLFAWFTVSSFIRANRIGKR